MLKRFWHDERGISVVEYGLIIALLSLVIVAGIGRVGNAMEDLLGNRIAGAF